MRTRVFTRVCACEGGHVRECVCVSGCLCVRSCPRVCAHADAGTRVACVRGVARVGVRMCLCARERVRACVGVHAPYFTQKGPPL